MRNRILGMVPQRRPFRFISEIRELDSEHIVGVYRFSEDEYFYQGHFPGFPVTPGVILIETMAQTGVVAFGIYLQMLQNKAENPLDDDMIALFTFADGVEFNDVVRPGETVTVSAKKSYFRGNQLKAECAMTRQDGTPICSGFLTGRAVPREKLNF